MDFGITAAMACVFASGALIEHFRGRKLVEEAIERAEAATRDVQVAMLHFDRRATTTETPVPGQGDLL